jgi:adenylate cyclase class 2
MREVERKLRVGQEELERVADFCAREGFTALDETAQTDRYFTPPDRNIYQEDMALRLRTDRRGDREDATLTFKGKGRDTAFHDRMEIETGVEGSGAIIGILSALGFREVLIVKKIRKSYAKGPATISFDEVEGLGCFVEVECVTEDTEAGKKRAVSVIYDLVEKLDIETAADEPRNYLELLVASKYEGGSTDG